VAAKKKNAKAGSVPPLKKKYIYYLIFGLAVLGVMRGKDIVRFLQKKMKLSSSASSVVKTSGTANGTTGGFLDKQVLLRAVTVLSEISLDATNQLTVVSYTIAAGQNQDMNPNQKLARIPRITAVFRNGMDRWRARTIDGQVLIENETLTCQDRRLLRVVYLDEGAVLLCDEADGDRPHPQVALPVGDIQQDDVGRLLLVEGRKVYEGDHILFAGWDFKIDMIASDRVKTAVKPIGEEEGQVVLYQFIL